MSGKGTHLGRLCKRGHDHMHTGKSLRYNANHVCTACASEFSRGKIAKLPKPDPGDGTGFAVTNGHRATVGTRERFKNRNRKDPRMCVSLKGSTIVRLRQYAKARGVSMASLLERWADEEMRR